MINKLLLGGLLIVGLALVLVVVPNANQASAQPQIQSTQQASSFSYAQLSIAEQEYLWDEGKSQIPRTRTLNQLQRQLGSSDRASLVNLLNAIGSNGWELVSLNDSETVWYFKRNTAR